MASVLTPGLSGVPAHNKIAGRIEATGDQSGS
jgi:hypothetical protein